MGIANPRPAMRSREERNIREKLAHHMAMLRLILNSADGLIDPAVASHEAARLTQTRKVRKTIWKTKRFMTTEQVGRQMLRDVQAMSPDETAELRTHLTRAFGPVAQGLAEAARKLAREEAAMAQPPITEKIQ
jgi:hypothetical protein